MLPRTCCNFDNCVKEYLSNISSNHTSEKFANNQSICCTNYYSINSVINTLTAILRRVLILRAFKAWNFGRYNAACNFPVLLNKREKYFMLKGIYSSKGTYVRVKKEITKFCNKISMKVNLLVEFNGEK